MLTADLVRATLRSGALRPTFLRGKNDTARIWAAQLIALYERSSGRSREDVDADISDIIGDRPDFLLARGLAKLLDDRSEWSAEPAVDPELLRAELWDASFIAAKRVPAAATEPHPPALEGGDARLAKDIRRRRTRADVIAEVCQKLQIDSKTLEETMFADHRSQEILQQFEAIEVDELLARYDVSLAQAVILRATELTLTLKKVTSGQLRALFRAMKFHQLLFDAERAEDGAWTIRVDGPLNILQRSGRYGLQLAQLVPTLLHFPKWSLEATLRWPGRDEPVVFELSDKDKLQPPGKLRGAWVSAEQELLVTRIQEANKGWEVVEDVEIVELDGREVLIPDVVLRHSDGRQALVEVVGTWRREWLERRLALLREHGPPNLVLCVSRSLAARHNEEGALPGDVVVFAQVIPMGKVLAAAERVAR